MEGMLPLRGVKTLRLRTPALAHTYTLWDIHPAHTGVEYWGRGVLMSKLHCIKLYLKQKAESDNGGT